MSDQPETLDAALAAMRRYADIVELGPPPIGKAFADLFREYANRIEAAAKREHAEWHAETEAAKDARNRVACRMRSEFAAKCRACKAAPVNAAALREALERFVVLFDRGEDVTPDEAYSCANEARAALTAPARNCDRYATAEEAVAAFADHLRAWENAHGILSEYPDHPVQVPAGAFAWLFAPAEGGAE